MEALEEIKYINRIMKTNKTKFTFTILVLLISITAFAQGPPGGGRGGRQGGGDQQRQKPDASEILKLLDTNNDDLIDKDEASKDERGKISEDFDIIDANEDGFIDFVSPLGYILNPLAIALFPLLLYILIECLILIIRRFTDKKKSESK